MKMSLSGWFQRGTKKKPKAQAPRPVSNATTAIVAWVDGEGASRSAKALLGQRFEGGIDIGLADEIPVDTPLWLLSEDGFDRVASVHFCGGGNGHYTVRVGFLDGDSTEADDATEAPRMRWIEGASRIVGCAVSFENSEAGNLTVTMAEAVPVPSVVLLTGGGYQCLGSVRGCDEEKDRWVADVKVISEAYPRPGLQAA